MVFTYRSNPCSRLLLQANATWLPSGENVGEISRPGRLVKGVILTEEKSGVPERFRSMTRAAVTAKVQRRIMNVIRSFLARVLDDTPVESGCCRAAEDGAGATGPGTGM